MSNDLYARFPRTEVEGVSLPRLLIGTNWMLGWSHTTSSADRMIDARFPNPDSYMDVFEAYLRHGIDAAMCPFTQSTRMMDAVRMAEDRFGHSITLIDTPRIDVDDNAQSRQDAESVIQQSAKLGSKICLIHHSCAEQLVNKNKGTIERLGDYTDMIRQAGMIPGLSAHMPELIVYSDLNEYDVATYIQIYNCLGFLMQVEVETVANIIHNAKKPVMTIKSMAAGRTTPFIGLTFSWNTIRPCDMVTVGAFTGDEAEEDIQISLAAIEHRFPNMGRRGSPASNQAAFGAGYRHQVQQ